MKKITYLIFGIIAMALTACQADKDAFDYGLTAVMESATPVTKTSLSLGDQGVHDVLWSADDKIAVYIDDAVSPSIFTLTRGAGSTTGYFTGDGAGESYTAFYPNTMLTSRSGVLLTIELPAEQEYVPGTFAQEAYPMAAVSNSKNLQFRNLCSVVRLSLKGTAMVNKIVFRPENPSIKVSGTATVDLSKPAEPALTMADNALDSVALIVTGGVQLTESEATDFFLVLPPQTYTSGFVVELYDDKDYYEKFYTSDFTMKRSKMHKAALSDYKGPITSHKWLTFTSQGVTSIGLENVSDNAPVLYYSKDTKHWTTWDYSPLIFTADSPIYICGDNPDGFSFSSDKYSYFMTYDLWQTPSSKFSISGDIMSLINKDEDLLTIPNDYCFQTLFYNCEELTSGPALPATTLKESCYQGMFFGCSGLTAAPVLPATTAPKHCYSAMFFGCAGLTEAPVLPATTLGPGCYQSMFFYCDALEVAQESLPADVLEESCYENMFYNCKSLLAAPVLPATTLADRCYASMFFGCEAITSMPELPATTLTKECYQKMFSGCKNLAMFPDELPATTLAEGCYEFMFEGCTSMESAPVLPATTLAPFSYSGMFSSCSNLCYVKCLATDISASGSTVYWLNGISSSGTFIKDKDMHDWKGGLSGMPYEWFVENGDGSVFAVNYLTFFAGQAQSAPNCFLSLDNYGGNAPVLYYSDDATNWKLWGYGDAHFSDTDMLYICGDNPGGFSKSCSEIANDNSGVFSSFNKTQEGSSYPFYVIGDVMSLISKDVEVTTIPCDYCFCRLFMGTPSLRNAPTLSATILTKHCYDRMFSQATDLTSPPEGLPATTMKDSCYFAMFEGCSKIDYAPELLATTLADGCYHSMFSGCYALQEAPELPATTLAKACYQSMFNGCGSLTDAPELPATELAEACYFKMFSGCGELVNATELSAMTLAPKCYWQMFYNCKKLQAAPDLPATTLAQDCYTSMFSRCENLSVAPEVLPATTLVKNCYNEMFYGCKNLEVAPELPATTLTPGCYYSMFNGCSKLHNIKCLATDISATNCVTDWVSDVAKSGTFIKAPAMTAWSSGNSGIPSDWIIQDAD